MKVTLQTNGALDLFEARNEAGQSIAIGTNGKAVGPMESVLMAAAGCSTIDIIMILQKMKQGVTDVKVEVEGTRQEAIPRVFTGIHLHYIIIGEVKEKKAAQAVASSLEKYCSVSLMLEKAATITSSFEIQPK